MKDTRRPERKTVPQEANPRIQNNDTKKQIIY